MSTLREQSFRPQDAQTVCPARPQQCEELSSLNDARTPAAGGFRILHRLVVFGIDDVQTGRPAGGQELLIGADDREPERLQLQRQGQMQQLR